METSSSSALEGENPLFAECSRPTESGKWETCTAPWTTCRGHACIKDGALVRTHPAASKWCTGNRPAPTAAAAAAARRNAALFPQTHPGCYWNMHEKGCKIDCISQLGSVRRQKVGFFIVLYLMPQKRGEKEPHLGRQGYLLDMLKSLRYLRCGWR